MVLVLAERSQNGHSGLVWVYLDFSTFLVKIFAKEPYSGSERYSHSSFCFKVALNQPTSRPLTKQTLNGLSKSLLFALRLFRFLFLKTILRTRPRQVPVGNIARTWIMCRIVNVFENFAMSDVRHFEFKFVFMYLDLPLLPRCLTDQSVWQCSSV